jgi:hypothetical protein
MGSPFAPIEAGTTEDAAGALTRRLLESDAEPIQEVDSLFCHGAGVRLDFCVPSGDEGVGDGDA